MIRKKEHLLISSDHNGINLKEKIQKKFSNNYNFIDLGPHTNDKVDYTDYASTLSNIVSKNQIPPEYHQRLQKKLKVSLIIIFNRKILYYM